MSLLPFPVEWLDLPDDELGLRLFAWWVGFQAERRGIAAENLSEEVVESIRVATLDMDTDDASHAALEKALRRVARGDAEGGGAVFKALMEDGKIRLAALDEAATGRRKQQKYAKKSRPDGLQVLIETIVANDPEISTTDLLNALRMKVGGDVVEEVDVAEGVIEWRDEKHPAATSPISGLKDRLSRAKKKRYHS